MLLPYQIRFCRNTRRQQANLAAVTEAVAKLVEVVEATNRLGKISSNSVLGSIVSATNFRFGFGLRQAQPPHQPPFSALASATSASSVTAATAEKQPLR